jgi:hypothetical protein
VAACIVEPLESSKASVELEGSLNRLEEDDLTDLIDHLLPSGGSSM